MRTILHIEEKTDRKCNREKTNKPIAYRRLCKRMHRADYAAAGEERAEDGKQKRGENQPHVPGLQHPAFFLHHYGMEESSAGEPGHQRRVLHRIPAPVASPTQDRISPMRAEKNAAGKKAPSHHRPAASDLNPL